MNSSEENAYKYSICRSLHLIEKCDNPMSPIARIVLEENISKNIQRDENKLEEIFNEMKKDLKNLFIEKRISQLESKFSENMDENTFNEIKELKKLQNNN